MSDCYESKLLLICRYQYVSLPLLPKVAQVHKFCYTNITIRKCVEDLKIAIQGNS